MTHPLSPDSPLYEQMQDAGRVASHHDPIAPHVICSRCGLPTLLEGIATYVGESGLVTRFCPSCDAKVREAK